MGKALQRQERAEELSLSDRCSITIPNQTPPPRQRNAVVIKPSRFRTSFPLARSAEIAINRETERGTGNHVRNQIAPHGATLAGLTLAALVGVAGFAATAAAKDKLTVYTALEEEQLPVYKQAFEAANPNYEIEWVRDSTGVITARLLAEKANPQADAVWGLAATSLMALDKEGMLEGYKPKGYADIKDDFKDKRTDTPTWVGMDAWASAICFNTAEARSRACRSRKPGRTC